MATITVTAHRPTTTVWITYCQWCGSPHTGVCSRVKAIEYHPNGQIARVEFHDSAFRVVVGTDLDRLPATYPPLADEDEG